MARVGITAGEPDPALGYFLLERVFDHGATRHLNDLAKSEKILAVCILDHAGTAA
jgi:hypothetical protein